MSETDFLKLKKHDNPETNTEKFDIENYLNGNWDKIDKNVGEVNTNISNINSKNKEQDTNIKQLQGNTETSSNKIAELEKELKEAQEDFYQNSIRGQASGEYIHVEDSSNCRAKIGIGGNHEQEMRSGKNYLNTLAKYKAGEKVTVDGITYIFNEDGSITCNGTATADSVLTFSSNLQTINGSGKKIVGMITGTQVPAKLSILAYTSDWSKNTFELLSSVNKNITINMQENIDYTIFRIIAYKGTTLNNQTIYYQILDTSVNDLTYEQYGAMPSPDYQSEVKSVGSNINILPSNLFSSTALKGINYTNKDGIITVNGTSTENSFYTKTITLKAGTYTLNGAPKGSAQDRYCLQAQGLGAGDFGSGQTFTIDTEKQVTLRIMVWKGITVNNIIFKPKIIKGTVATPYSKFGQGCVKVTKCNNNLFNKNDIVNKAYINSSGEIVSNDGQNYTNYISVVSNAMYTIHAENPLGAVTAICFYDTNKKFLSGSTYNNVKSMSFKTPSNCDFVRASVSNINLETLQIEEGPATTYEEHEEQSYIMPVQKEMLQGDYFDFDNEKEEHKWIKLIFDGTENWLQSGNTYPTFYISPYEIASKFGIPAGLKAFCNYFSQKSNIWGIDEIGFDTANLRQDHVDFRFCLGSSSTITTLEAWKKKLVEMHNSGKPLALYFQILNLNELDFTDEQKAVAKELNNARTYKNVTNITTDSKAILSLDYAKDLETQNQKMQNEIDEIKQLLSTTQTSALLLDNMQTDIESEVE